MGGWYNGRLPGHRQQPGLVVERWPKLEVDDRPDTWSARCAGVTVEHRGRMVLLGGTENYYFGDEASLKNDIWQSTNGQDWQMVTQQAPGPLEHIIKLRCSTIGST